MMSQTLAARSPCTSALTSAVTVGKDGAEEGVEVGKDGAGN